MSSKHGLKEVTEGATTFFVPLDTRVREVGPGSRTKEVFFNPAMRENRDVSVLVERAIASDGWTILDGLAATGARSMRLYSEGCHDCRITVNDHNPAAYEILKKNIENWSRVGRLKPSKRGLHGLLPESKYHWVDIDPFGSPSHFLDGAVRAVKSKGILSITATDTAPLCGTYPTTCIRRYGARPLHSGTMHDTGLRILLGNVIKRAACFDISATPILSYFSGHYFRAYFRMRKGARLADGLLKKTGFVVKNRKAGYRTVRWPAEGEIYGGPMWLGPINDQELLSGLVKEATKMKEIMSPGTPTLLESLSAEIGVSPFVYMTDEIASDTGTHPPNTLKMIAELRDREFRASPVHYDTKGLRTDAPWETISQVARLLHK